MQKLAIAPLRLYQLCLSPLLGPRCRFYPSCSNYAIQAITTHGTIKGGALAARRLCRCHPGSAGGIDPVPEKNSQPQHASSSQRAAKP
ncbi:MAG: membrane protein insertion efficiency factor YidD [Gammaproteobacteria bacterium]|nr:membrane protein insertion efficiency factor YidD [Gammaproteobacteria bacterium]MBT8150343.1 membrane protein insertion efficiency factor YidD [Gammaproteobacteria bacterium]